ncbi:MAG: hypothetical protein ACLUYV_06155 [Alistipes shahii]
MLRRPAPAPLSDSVTITGRKEGIVRPSTFAFSPTRTGQTAVAARSVSEIDPPEHIQGPLIETIVAELRGEGRCPSTGASAARVSRAADRIISE